MASKTAARSGTRTSRSKATPRASGSRRPRPAPARKRVSKPAKRHQRSLLVAAGLTCGRAMHATWLLAARGTGGAARSIGRARDIEPGHRRDGIALVLLGLAVVVAASSWFDAARPVGAWVDAVLRTFVGAGVLALPVGLAVVAVVLMRTQPNPDARPRLILGASMISFSLLGLRHLWSGSPEDPELRRRAAGFIGFAIGGPLSEGLTPWIAAPLLFIGALFGLLLLTGTTIRELPEMTRAMFGTRLVSDLYADEDDDYADTTTTAHSTRSQSGGHRRTRPPSCWTSRSRTKLPPFRNPPSKLAMPTGVVAPPRSRTPRCWTGSSKAPTRCRRWSCW
jgi:S-DNA-T family DNA segregation ATPase FtsK/SpoIIIE